MWFTPSRTKKINGLAIGFFALPADGYSQEINGVNIEANPIAILIGAFSFVAPFYIIAVAADGNLKTERKKNKDRSPYSIEYRRDSTIRETINGLDISSFSMAHKENKGLTFKWI